MDEIKVFDPNNKFQRITDMLKLFDDIENPYSPSGDRGGRISVHSTGMGPRILSDNKGHDWEELLLMVSNEKDRVAFRQLFNHFAPRIKSFLMKAGDDPTMAEECSQEAMATVWNKAQLFDPTWKTSQNVSTWAVMPLSSGPRSAWQHLWLPS